LTWYRFADAGAVEAWQVIVFARVYVFDKIRMPELHFVGERKFPRPDVFDVLNGQPLAAQAVTFRFGAGKAPETSPPVPGAGGVSH
jgi:hypothetical protein